MQIVPAPIGLNALIICSGGTFYEELSIEVSRLFVIS